MVSGGIGLLPIALTLLGAAMNSPLEHKDISDPWITPAGRIRNAGILSLARVPLSQLKAIWRLLVINSLKGKPNLAKGRKEVRI